jgi:peroxisomal enoyl-CoA hydratase 2
MASFSSNPASAVYEFPPQAVSWLKRDLLLFANTIGCEKNELHFLFVSNMLLTDVEAV